MTLTQYPLRVEQKSEPEDGIGTRRMTRGDLIEFSLLQIPKRVLWVHLPDFGMQPLRKLKKVLSFNKAKKIIKAYCKTLPI